MGSSVNNTLNDPSHLQNYLNMDPTIFSKNENPLMFDNAKLLKSKPETTKYKEYEMYDFPNSPDSKTSTNFT